MFPQNIHIPSDDTKLCFHKINEKTKVITYIYTKSIAKLGMQLEITETQLQKNIQNNVFFVEN